MEALVIYGEDGCAHVGLIYGVHVCKCCHKCRQFFGISFKNYDRADSSECRGSCGCLIPPLDRMNCL